MKNLSYKQVIHNLMWITFFIYFSKITLQIHFYVLQYRKVKKYGGQINEKI